jgi:hypothetical protein
VTLCIDERILLNANIHVVVRWSSGLWHRVVIYWTISGKKKKDHEDVKWAEISSG